MKKMICLLGLFVGIQTQAQQMRTQDNVNYVIVVKSEANIQLCASQIRKISAVQGNGQVRIIGQTIGIIGANLTTMGALKVRQLACVDAVELDGEVQANPRIGRSN